MAQSTGMLIFKLFEHLFLRGNLTVLDWRGNRYSYGDGSGPAVTIKLHDSQTEWDFLKNPKLALGELFTDERLTVEEGTLFDFLTLCANNRGSLKHHKLLGVREYVRPLFLSLITNNPLQRSLANVSHHYDLDERLYRLFLDEDMQYSCAYFRSPDDTLEQAQYNKKVHLASKMHITQPGLRVLDVGCGWGGMALHLAREHECRVTGITLSKEQLRVAQQRAKDEGLDKLVDFQLMDYRNMDGKFDRIVSVEMLEHVGVNNNPVYFRKMQDLLKPDGVFALHWGGRMGPPGAVNPWIEKYIFPGGYTPSLSEITAVIEKVVFWINDVENQRLHFADTLKEWHKRFSANRAEVAKLYDERFCRLWDYYLIACEVSFRSIGQCVYQMQLTLERDSVPLTRDPMLEWELAQYANQA